MLVLTRKKGESIFIGEDIEVAILEIKGDNIKLGITAPKHVPVHRKEVLDAIKEENKVAQINTKVDLSTLGQLLKNK